MCTENVPPLPIEDSMPSKDLPQVIPAQMRRVNNLISRRVNYYSRENGVEDVTAMHGWILAYLYQYQDREIFQRDIERAFSITRSTVTNILQLMEKKGYIRRMSVPQDARLKRLVLTEAGAEAHRQILRSLHPDRRVGQRPAARRGERRAAPPAEQAAGRPGMTRRFV